MSFQDRVGQWIVECFGPQAAADRTQRHNRFLEESLELVQATGCSAADAHQLVDYVYGRPAGDRMQEVGGVMVTLAALCQAHGIDMVLAGDTELARCWRNTERIRTKEASKPEFGPLPGSSGPSEADDWSSQFAAAREVVRAAGEVVRAAQREERRHLERVDALAKSMPADQRTSYRVAHTASCDLAGVLAMNAHIAGLAQQLNPPVKQP